MNVFENIFVLLSKETISRKGSKSVFLTPDNFFKRKIFTPRAMKVYIQISYKESISEGRRCVQVQGL